MRKTITTVLLIGILLVTFSTANAQCGQITHRHGNLIHRHYACVGDNHKHGRSFWNKHRDKLTVVLGSGAGAGIGALINGKSGALVGSLIGGAGSAAYTYGIRKHRRAARYR